MSHSRSYLNFAEDLLPHLDAAYNLARWLTHNEQDAEDVVQEGFVRALRFFEGFRGGNTRTWLLRIVRNTCYTFLQSNRQQPPTIEFDESVFSPDNASPNPEEALLHNHTKNLVRTALERLPEKLREVVILREFEGMSYKEISEITAIPPGTVMSRLSRARGELRHSLAKFAQENHLPSPTESSEIGRKYS